MKRSKIRPGPPLVEALQVPGATPKPGRAGSVGSQHGDTGENLQKFHAFMVVPMVSLEIAMILWWFLGS